MTTPRIRERTRGAGWPAGGQAAAVVVQVFVAMESVQGTASAALVQRRSGTRQLRIGAGQLELHST